MRDKCPTCGSHHPEVDTRGNLHNHRSFLKPTERCSDVFHKRCWDGELEQAEAALEDAYDYIRAIGAWEAFMESLFVSEEAV